MLHGQIQAFVEVVRLGTVSRAAEALYVTQPALTARLHGLERELGQPLFARSGRGLRLTAAGRAFLPYAERAVRAISEGRNVVEDLAAGRAGRLMIGATGSVASYFLPQILKRFTLEHPRVELVVRTGYSEHVLDLVLNEQVDLAIARDVYHPDIEAIPLHDDELILVAHTSYPLAGHDSTTLAEIAVEGLILFDRATSYYELTQSLFGRVGAAPRTVMEMDNFEAAKKMLEQGLGAALVPRISVQRELELGQLVELKVADAGPIHRRIVVIRRVDVGEPSGVARAFLNLLLEISASETGRTLVSG